MNETGPMTEPDDGQTASEETGIVFTVAPVEEHKSVPGAGGTRFDDILSGQFDADEEIEELAPPKRVLAPMVNNLAGAYFTPVGLARDFAVEVGGDTIVDLCNNEGWDLDDPMFQRLTQRCGVVERMLVADHLPPWAQRRIDMDAIRCGKPFQPSPDMRRDLAAVERRPPVGRAEKLLRARRARDRG